MISYHKIYMSPVQSSNLQSQLCALWKKQKLCDAVIKSDKMSVMAHRLVLAASCPMLQSMENYSFGSLLEIRVESDMTKESVMAFLQYLYEGYLMLTEENYSHVERLARSMHIDSIISCCEDFSQSILSSRSNIHGPTDQADFKHVRKTNLLRVLDSSQKQPYKCSNSDFSKRLKQPSSNHSSSESIALKQVSRLCPALFQGGQHGQGERIELRHGSFPSNQSESYLTSSNMVSTNVNTKKALGEGVMFFSNVTCNFKEGSSTSLNSTGPPPVQMSGCGSQLNGCPLTPTISNVHSLQTVQSSNFELGKKTPQAEPYPVLLKKVQQSSSPFSCNSAKVSASCAGIDKDDDQPISSQSLSLEQQLKETATSGDKGIFFSNANFKEGSSTSVNSTGPQPVQTSGHGGQRNGCPLTPTISNVHSLQTVQSSNFELGKKTPQAEPYPVLLKEVQQSLKFLSGDSSGVSDFCASIDQKNEQPVLKPSSSMQQLDIHLNESSKESWEKSNSAASSDLGAEGGNSVIKVEPENCITQTDDGMFMSVSERDETQTVTQKDETQKSPSSRLHDNSSLSSEESSGQEEMSSTSETGMLKVKRRNIAGRVYKKGIPMGIDYRKKVIDYMERNGAQRGEYYLPRGLQKKASQHLRVSPTTITRLWAQYCKEGCVKIPVQIKRGRKKKLSKEDIEYIQFLKQSKPSMLLSDIRDELLKKSNLKKTVGLTTISRALFDLNMTCKRKSKV